MELMKKITLFLVLVTFVSFSAQLVTQRNAAAITYNVTNTNSSGAGSFTQAVADANTSPGADTINFSIAGSGPHVITILGPIYISDTVTIDATGLGGSTCATTETPASWNVQFDFNRNPNARLHFELGSSGSILRGLSLVDSSDYVAFVYSDDVQFECNGLQMNPDGSEVSTGSGYIHYAANGSGTIGGPDIDDRNYFFGSSGAMSEVDGVSIRNNYFGVSRDGASEPTLNNTDSWIAIRTNATNINIEDNVIANGRNALSGINLTGNTIVNVRGNMIGTNAEGTQAFGLSNNAIQLHGALGEVNIGGPQIDDRNVIASSSGNGIHLQAVGSEPVTTIQNNYIGVLANGDSSGNAASGVEVTGGELSVIDNVISDNGGVAISFAGPLGVVKGNKIGVDPTGTVSTPNSQGGFAYYPAYSTGDITVGGSEGEGNTIVNNGDGAGIRIYPLYGAVTTVDISYNELRGNNNEIAFDNTNVQEINGSISNNNIVDSRGNGIFAYSQGELAITDNTISGSTYTGIFTERGNHTIQGNVVSDSAAHGLDIVGTSTSTVISGNTVENSAAHGILVRGGVSGEVVNNTVTSSGEHGILIEGGTLEFSGNDITDSSSNGLTLNASANFDIHNNVITDNVLKGISVSDNSTGVIYENIIHSNGGINLDVDGDGVNFNDSGDNDSILNTPLVRGSYEESGNTIVVFSTDLQAGDYRFDVCYNPSGVATGGGCEVFKETINVDDVPSGTTEFEITVLGTGYTTSLFTMQSVERSGIALIKSSEFGTYQTYSANLSIQALLTVSMVGGLSDVGIGDTFVSPGGNGAYGMGAFVCHEGGEIITRLQFNLETEGFDGTGYYLDPTYSTASNLGSLTAGGMWTGELDPGQCLSIYILGEVTGELETTMQIDAEVTVEELNGNLDGLDPDESNNTRSLSLPITDQPDIAMTSRLLTQGDITTGTDVSYELTIGNIGAGSSSSGFLMLAFLLPEGADFSELVDTDPDDGVGLVDGTSFGIDPDGCTEPALAADMSPGLAAYTGQVVRCAVGYAGSLSTGFETKFRLDMTAGTGFVSGSTRAIAVVMSFDEAESLQFMNLFGAGQDGFTLGLNNIAWLTYDSDPLTVTINRCPGVNAVVTINDACFKVIFNKPIYAPEFTVEDLVLQGGGSVYSFVQDSSTQWTVRITNMTQGGTLRLLLGPASVVDLSAIENGVQVLGENVIRFGTEISEEPSNVDGQVSGSNSAEGSLAATGVTSDWFTPITLVLIGLLLIRVTKRRRHI